MARSLRTSLFSRATQPSSSLLTFCNIGWVGNDALCQPAEESALAIATHAANALQRPDGVTAFDLGRSMSGWVGTGLPPLKH